MTWMMTMRWRRRRKWKRKCKWWSENENAVWSETVNPVSQGGRRDRKHLHLLGLSTGVPIPILIPIRGHPHASPTIPVLSVHVDEIANSNPRLSHRFSCWSCSYALSRSRRPRPHHRQCPEHCQNHPNNNPYHHPRPPPHPPPHHRLAPSKAWPSSY